MATDPKIKQCPTCKTDEHVAVYKYDHGWQHVECDKCDALGPGCGNRRQAIKAWNEKVASSSPQSSTPIEAPSVALATTTPPDSTPVRAITRALQALRSNP